MAWTFKQSSEVKVNREHAWKFWTTVENWLLDSAIVWVKLDGPFQPGAKGTTMTTTPELVYWEIVSVDVGEGAVIEIPLPGAVARFAWRFEELPNDCTRLNQEITLTGDQAESYAGQMGAGFEQGIRDGMQKLCTEMERSKEVRYLTAGFIPGSNAISWKDEMG
ncbi:MAG: hypothetical protein JWQ71_1765 [Pedosphaera sp.]|nr:hypothetical protein [Pedosphaera sp.]